MLTLGLDTSNYATSVSLVDNANHKIIFNEKVFLPVKSGQVGIRQQDAVFQHTKTLEKIFNNIKNNYNVNNIKGIGVSDKPSNDENSYMPCFLVGKTVATALSTMLNVPLITCSHQQGHITSALFSVNNSSLFEKEILMLHISGGTSDILLVKDGSVAEKIGTSNDLYAGQAIDRLGIKLGFPFPAGEFVSKSALGFPNKIKVMPSVKGFNCNLSGLENKCDMLLSKGFSESYVCKYCLTYIAQSLIKMLENVQSKHGDKDIIFAGGVMSSDVIREIILSKFKSAYFATPELSKDNAVGVAHNCYRRIKYG